jgi:hypothetical protein
MKLDIDIGIDIGIDIDIRKETSHNALNNKQEKQF